MTRREQIFEELKRPPLGSHMKWLFMDEVMAKKIYQGEVGQLYGMRIVTSSVLDEKASED